MDVDDSERPSTPRLLRLPLTKGRSDISPPASIHPFISVSTWTQFPSDAKTLRCRPKPPLQHWQLEVEADSHCEVNYTEPVSAEEPRRAHPPSSGSSQARGSPSALTRSPLIWLKI